ncbi:DUF4336 domain-containing protein [Paracoccus sp. (in: a-proteobacteria)]|uniref:DUF4336 domain-containing protein n=1 Tax=Paracoccus sp. TaxID=267 RepID=UPI00396CADD5
MTQVTYPPLDTPKPVAADVWIVDSGPLKAMGMLPLPVRMTVFRLQDKSLLLHSPTRFTSDLLWQLTDLGAVRHMVAPNSAHWTMLKDWQQAVPDAVTWAAPGLRDRGQVKRSGLRLDRDLDEHDAEGWPAELERIDIRGIGGFHEICLFHEPSRTMVMTDLIQNLEKPKMPAAVRPLLSLAGNAAPNGRAPGYLRAVVKLKGQSAREAARRLVSLQPERVIFAHGAWFERDGTARLKQSLDWLIRD